jgi:cytochrome c-type biogenesis protein CcmH/NrfF
MRLASALLLSLLLVGACAVTPRQEQPPAPPPAYPEQPREQPPAPPPAPQVTPERPPVPAPVYPKVTHGALDPSVTSQTIQTTICISHYTDTVRPPASYTNPIKRRLMEDVLIGWSHASEYELDYIIPLGVGGAPRAEENLQLLPLEGTDGAKRKNRIEKKLQCLVCSGQLPLAVAQAEVADNWQAAYKRYASVKCKRSKRQPVPEED